MLNFAFAYLTAGPRGHSTLRILEPPYVLPLMISLKLFNGQHSPKGVNDFYFRYTCRFRIPRNLCCRTTCSSSKIQRLANLVDHPRDLFAKVCQQFKLAAYHPSALQIGPSPISFFQKEGGGLLYI